MIETIIEMSCWMDAPSNIKDEVFVILEITTTFTVKEKIPSSKCIAKIQKIDSLKFIKMLTML